jgi:hypothetical protein
LGPLDRAKLNHWTTPVRLIQIFRANLAGDRIEKKVEICATNLANKTKRMSTNAAKKYNWRTETDPVSKTQCSLVPRILDNRKSPKTQ